MIPITIVAFKAVFIRTKQVLARDNAVSSPFFVIYGQLICAYEVMGY